MKTVRISSIQDDLVRPATAIKVALCAEVENAPTSTAIVRNSFPENVAQSARLNLNLPWSSFFRLDVPPHRRHPEERWPRASKDLDLLLCALLSCAELDLADLSVPKVFPAQWVKKVSLDRPEHPVSTETMACPVAMVTLARVEKKEIPVTKAQLVQLDLQAMMVFLVEMAATDVMACLVTKVIKDIEEKKVTLVPKVMWENGVQLVSLETLVRLEKSDNVVLKVSPEFLACVA